MDNSYPAKALTILRSLARSPAQLPRYLRYLPVWRRQPIDCEIPWIAFPALREIERFLRPQHAVFEYGGGGSTLFFARRAAQVLTMESDPAWHAQLSAVLRARGLQNAACELHPITGDLPEQFAADAFFHRIRESRWDLVLVDCFCGYSRTRYGQIRPHALQLAMEQVKPGGLVVLDDSWMFAEYLQPRAGWEITDYVGLGPCRYGVTSTALLRKR